MEIKKSVVLLLLLCLLLSLASCKEEPKPPFEYLEYPFVDRTSYGITRCCTKDEDIVIPETYNGHPVEYIGKEAFLGTQTLRTLSMKSVIEISESAFCSCHYLSSVQLGDVQRIGKLAFRDCIDLKEIVIPEAVTELGGNAFSDCSKLETVIFKGNPEKIGVDVFGNSPNVTIYGPAGGTVEAYAAEYEIPFVATE